VHVAKAIVSEANLNPNIVDHINVIVWKTVLISFL
jgi:hypothetical protein